MVLIDSWPCYFLSQHPLLILLVAIVVAFGAIGCRSHTLIRPVLTASAVIWCGYAIWELRMLRWRSSTGDMAIRVDALFIEPAMQVLLLSNILLVFYCLVRAMVLQAPNTSRQAPASTGQNGDENAVQ